MNPMIQSNEKKATHTNTHTQALYIAHKDQAKKAHPIYTGKKEPEIAALAAAAASSKKSLQKSKFRKLKINKKKNSQRKSYSSNSRRCRYRRSSSSNSK